MEKDQQIFIFIFLKYIIFLQASVACLGHVYVNYIPQHIVYLIITCNGACLKTCMCIGEQTLAIFFLSFFLLTKTTAYATSFYPTSQVCMLAIMLLVA